MRARRFAMHMPRAHTRTRLALGAKTTPNQREATLLDDTEAPHWGDPASSILGLLAEVREPAPAGPSERAAPAVARATLAGQIRLHADTQAGGRAATGRGRALFVQAPGRVNRDHFPDALEPDVRVGAIGEQELVLELSRELQR